MSFFSQNATVSNGGGFPVAEPGVYACRLKEVEVVKQTKYGTEDEMVDNFRWVFLTTEEMDEEGNPYRFTMFTGTSYGNDKAKLTLLIDKMVGRRLKDQEFFNLDLEALKRQVWSVSVDTAVSQKGSEYNRVSWVRPAKQEPKPKTTFGAMAQQNRRPVPQPVEDQNDGLDDPFAE